MVAIRFWFVTDTIAVPNSAEGVRDDPDSEAEAEDDNGFALGTSKGEDCGVV